LSYCKRHKKRISMNCWDIFEVSAPVKCSSFCLCNYFLQHSGQYVNNTQPSKYILSMYIHFHLLRPSVALVNNVWSCASTPPHIFRVFVKTKNKFFYVFFVYKLRISNLKHKSLYVKVVGRREP
jgi:hypothetical protein